MKVIIAGSRNIKNYNDVKKAIKESKFEITEIVSGGAKGVDKLGEQFAKEYNVSLKIFKAEWKKLEGVDPNFVKDGPYGFYNVNAGRERNEKMGDYADALIAVWDGSSRGTDHMINYMKKLKKKVSICFSIR